jgi:hypothetical protein
MPVVSYLQVGFLEPHSKRQSGKGDLHLLQCRYGSVIMHLLYISQEYTGEKQR